MEDIIVFGASKLGEIAHIMYRDEKNILFFVDNDINKVGGEICGLEIKDISELLAYPKIKVIIASQYFKEIEQQLIKMGIFNFEKVMFSFNNSIDQLDDDETIEFNEVNLGELLNSVGEIKMNNLVYMYGVGSGVLDYAFLKALMIKFDFKTYLEIGTFMGESMDAIADIAQKAYSVSLPDKTLGKFFKEKKMGNFGRYFSVKNNNCDHFYVDSRDFDYNIIKEKIDLVFIDGDHSYEGIVIDTKKIFDFIDIENTIVVWHDLRIGGKYRMDTVNAIKDVVNENILNCIYSVDNNICGVYIPDKYKNEFSFKKNEDEIYSYRTTIIPIKNILKN